MREPALLSIKEFAEICDVKQSALRYWDEIGLLPPAWRNTQTGYRYYAPEQMMTVNLTKLLVSLDIPLSRIAEMKETGRQQQVLELLSLCDKKMEEKIREMRSRKDVLRSYVSLIEECRAAGPGKIELRQLAERPIQRIPIANGDKGLRDSFRQAQGSDSPMGYAYPDLNALLETPDQPAQLVSYDPRGPDVRPAGQYLVGTARCPYGRNSGLAQRMHSYARQNRIEFRGPAYAVYLPDKAGATEPEQYLLQVAVRVKKESAGY